MSRYTEGPWEFNQSTNRISGAGGNTVADCRYKNCANDGPLLAAAPDLLAALKDIRMNNAGTDERKRGWDTALAAIAKAEGR